MKKDLGVNQEDASLLLGLSKAKSTAPITLAGRELDALVAEIVMGWKDVGCESNAHHTEYVPFGIPPGEHRRVRLLDFSTSIADAWLVVEKLATGFQRVDVVVERNRAICRVWRSGIHAYEEYETTAPVAICLAALRAAGGTNK